MVARSDHHNSCAIRFSYGHRRFISPFPIHLFTILINPAMRVAII